MCNPIYKETLNQHFACLMEHNMCYHKKAGLNSEGHTSELLRFADKEPRICQCSITANLIFIKRLQVLHPASLLFRDKPQVEVIHIQTQTLLPALKIKTRID